MSEIIVSAEVGMRTRTHVTFEAALRAAIEDSGLTLHGVQNRLARRGVQIAIATLSSWQTGHNRPERIESLRAVTALEELFGHAPGTLTALLGPRRSRGRQPFGTAGNASYESMPNSSTIAKFVGELWPLTPNDMAGVYMEEEVVLTAGRTLFEIHTRVLSEAKVDGVDRYFELSFAEPGADLDTMGVTALQHCRVGRVRRNHEERVVGTELLLDRVYNAGETFMIEYTSRFDQRCVDNEYFRALSGSLQLYVLRVRFEATELPVRCYRFQATHAEHPRTEAEIRPSNEHVALLPMKNPARGIAGIRWEWE
ncbi:hypothetical protein AB0M43_01210 [Longispora sp. NPDC051575]|uniref:hypothetical protein n=1 Tax=Longispora sp. NPDC051575 TaxID=3154943 RepID=UPI0034134F1E